MPVCGTVYWYCSLTGYSTVLGRRVSTPCSTPSWDSRHTEDPVGSRNPRCVCTMVWFAPPYLVLECTGSTVEQNLVLILLMDRRVNIKRRVE